MCLVLKGLLNVRYWTGISDHFEACGVYSPDFTVLLCVWLQPSCLAWQAHFTFHMQVNGVFTFSANMLYYVWNFISCKSYVLRRHLHVNAKMWQFCLLGRSCTVLYCLREVWTFVTTELDFYLGHLFVAVLRNIQCHLEMYKGCVLLYLMLSLCSWFMF